MRIRIVVLLCLHLVIYTPQAFSIWKRDYEFRNNMKYNKNYAPLNNFKIMLYLNIVTILKNSSTKSVNNMDKNIDDTVQNETLP